MQKGSAKAFLISCETIVDILQEMKVLQSDEHFQVFLIKFLSKISIFATL